MHSEYFFGYGSLVNRATHDYDHAFRATLTGWRRVWRHTPLREVAFLTAEPAEGVQIEGLIAAVPGGDWAALDVREHAYRREAVTHLVQHTAPTAPRIDTYAIPDGLHGPADAEHPVLLSYLDVVVQGYLREFGPDGVIRFFETTGGWSAPIRDDRAAPIYPRAQALDAGERALVDRMLARFA